MNARAAFAFAAALAGISAAGCRGASEAEPQNATLVCRADDSASCPPTDRATAFDRWARAAVRRPGSTFSIWIAGPDGARQPVFAACIPDRWGAGVMEAKAAFLREGHARAAASGPALPEGCVVPDDDGDGSVTLLEQGHRRVLESSRDAHHLVVVCDRSDSMLGTSCDAAALAQAFDGWLARSGAAAGSTFTVEGVGVTRDGVARLFHAAAARHAPAGERVAALLAARTRLAASLREAPTGSAIAEAISVAAEDLGRAGAGSRELLVLSDLRQVTPGTWNFEAAAPEPAAFVAWLRSNQLAPALRGSEVRVCGLHHRRAPGARAFDARLARRVEDAWKAAFDAMAPDAVTLEGGCLEAGERS